MAELTNAERETCISMTADNPYPYFRVQMPVTPVTLITRDATLDDLSAADYRDIYDELRGRDSVTGAYAVSLDKFVTIVTSAYSKAQWSKYHNGEVTLTRQMRNELRRAVGLTPLPLTVAEATAAASPDAAVWQIGQGPAEHVIMVTTPEPITLRVNGAVSVVEPAATTNTDSLVTEVTRARRNDRPRIRTDVTPTQNSRRLALGAQWREIIDAGLTALENQQNGGTHE